MISDWYGRPPTAGGARLRKDLTSAAEISDVSPTFRMLRLKACRAESPVPHQSWRHTRYRPPITDHPFDALNACSGQASHAKLSTAHLCKEPPLKFLVLPGNTDRCRAPVEDRLEGKTLSEKSFLPVSGEHILFQSALDIHRIPNLR